MSLEVFSACSGAPLRRFDLRRVVRFTYPQCAFQTMHALQKEVSGVKWAAIPAPGRTDDPPRYTPAAGRGGSRPSVGVYPQGAGGRGRGHRAEVRSTLAGLSNY